MAARLTRIFLYVAVTVTGVFLIAPTLIIVPMSFSDSYNLQFPPEGFSTRWYGNFFHTTTWTDGAIASLKIAVLSSLLATLIGTLTAVGLIRGRYPGKGIATAILLSPLVVPVVVVAVGMELLYSRWGLQGSILGFVLAHTTLALPYVVVSVSAGLRTVDPRLELAARTLGAHPVIAFVRITLPLILPAVLAGALFAFITSWDEVVIAIFLASPYVTTLPVVMWTQLHDAIDPTIAAVASMLTGVTIASLGLLLLTRRRVAA
jgi:putative spermidine/putrescine transport system permease protein